MSLIVLLILIGFAVWSYRNHKENQRRIAALETAMKSHGQIMNKPE